MFRLVAKPFAVMRTAIVSSRTYASHAHVVKPQETFVEALQKRFPSSSKNLTSRLEQLRKNHMKILSLDINWNVLKPEEKEESLRDMEDLINKGYSTMTAEQKKAVSLSNVYNADPTNIKLWDDLMSKNDELQLGDWKNMTIDEKKAAYYIAYGPVPQSDNSFKISVAIRVMLFIGAAYAIYSGLFSFFRSRKEVPTLSPEYREALKERMIRERMNPYSGVSAHLFTKDGIKNE